MPLPSAKAFSAVTRERPLARSLESNTAKNAFVTLRSSNNANKNITRPLAHPLALWSGPVHGMDRKAQDVPHACQLPMPSILYLMDRIISMIIYCGKSPPDTAHASDTK